MEEENKKAKRRIITLLIILLILINVVLFMYYYRTRVRREIAEQTITTTIDKEDIVEIKGKTISNEEKIDSFIESIGSKATDKLYVKYNKDYIVIEYFPGNKTVTDIDYNNEAFKNLKLTDEQKKNGFVKVTENSTVKYVFDITTHAIKRSIVDSKVKVYVTDYVESKENDLFEYELSSSGYRSSLFKIIYEREDEESEEIVTAYNYIDEEADGLECEVAQVGGTVKIIVEDKEYSLKEALESKIITPDDILKQAEMDYKYGICSSISYWDDSVEYYYGEYTILKMKDVLHNRNLYIGFPSVLRKLIRN